MRKILFDLSKTQPIGKTKVHGGGKYGIVVCKKLLSISPERVSVFYAPDEYLDDTLKKTIESLDIEVHFPSEGTIVDIANRGQYVIYTPLFSDDYLMSKNTPLLATIHGLRFLEMPSDSYEKYYERKRGFANNLLLKLGLNKLRLWLTKKKEQVTYDGKYEKWLSDKRCHFVIVSEHSKASLMSFVPSVKREQLSVFYSPSTIDRNIEVQPSSFHGQKFWLMVSGNRWLKNCLRAIEAFDSLFTQRPDIEGKVVITGLERINFRGFKINNRERFIAVGYVSESELASLYKDAYLFVYPSLNEGFGYPPLEAMYEDTPVIASAISSIPEVCGDAVMYFNPFLVSEIKMRILEMEDPQIREAYVRRGKERQRFIEEKQNIDLENLCKRLLSYTQM